MVHDVYQMLTDRFWQFILGTDEWTKSKTVCAFALDNYNLFMQWSYCSALCPGVQISTCQSLLHKLENDRCVEIGTLGYKVGPLVHCSWWTGNLKNLLQHIKIDPKYRILIIFWHHKLLLAGEYIYKDYSTKKWPTSIRNTLNEHI